MQNMKIWLSSASIRMKAFRVRRVICVNWLETIDDYLKMNRRDILTTKGCVTHKFDSFLQMFVLLIQN